MTFAATAAAFAAWQALVELLKRRVAVVPELPRKLVHVGSGILAAPLPYVLSYREIVALAALFGAVMAVSRSAHVFTAVHDVDRESWGELAFPLGVGALAALHPQPWAFVYALLVLALADTAAAAAGMRFGRRPLPLGGKSAAGSAAFFGVALAVGLPFAPLGACALVALAAAATEASLARGLDNLALPLVAGLLIGSV